MKTKTFSQILLVCTLLFLASCKKDVQNTLPTDGGVSVAQMEAARNLQSNTFYGPQTQMGDGKVRSFYTVTHTGLPVEIGVEMSGAAFTGLPHHGHSAFTLSLHQKAQEATPFDHIDVNWNPGGHPPFVLFGVPHFDFHFYTITEEAQEAIPAYTPGSLHDVLPPVMYRPVGHVPTPGGEAHMGKHWADILHPVIPGTFTHTMIYGSYNGQFNFIEPMITTNYLQSLGADVVSVPFNQPMHYQEPNTWYPTTYNMSYNAGTNKYYITLTNFVQSGDH